MSITAKTLWYVESHLSRDLTLDRIAGDLGVSPFHLARTFALGAGQPVMRYVWRRRLTRAARALAAGGTTVLAVALDAGYGSHEAFTRAFRAEFGLPPGKIRSAAGLAGLTLTDPMLPRTNMTPKLNPPVVEPMPERSLAGLSRRYTMATRAEIPSQWDAYNEVGERVADPVGEHYFGAAYGFDGEGFDYLCGQEVAGAGPLPDGFTRLTVPAGRYARFATDAHISTMNDVWSEVYDHWLSQPDLAPRPGPSLEYYPASFDPVSGRGGYEVWVPVA